MKFELSDLDFFFQTEPILNFAIQEKTHYI